MTNPFLSGVHDGNPTFVVDADNRLRYAKSFSLRECEEALKMDGLQKTVRTAIERRQRKLMKTLAERWPEVPND